MKVAEPSVRNSLDLARSLGAGENPFADAAIWNEAERRGFVRLEKPSYMYVLSDDWKVRVAMYARPRRGHQ